MAYSTIKNGSNYNHGTNHHEYLIDSINDVQNLPTDCAPDSIAYPADRSYVLYFTNNKQWAERVANVVEIGQVIDAQTTEIDWGTI